MKKHWKIIGTNGSTVKNHWKTIVTNGKTIGKTIDTNGWDVKNHRQRWFTSKKTIEKPLTTMVPWRKPLTFHRAQKFTIAVVYRLVSWAMLVGRSYSYWRPWVHDVQILCKSWIAHTTGVWASSLDERLGSEACPDNTHKAGRNIACSTCPSFSLIAKELAVLAAR